VSDGLAYGLVFVLGVTGGVELGLSVGLASDLLRAYLRRHFPEPHLKTSDNEEEEENGLVEAQSSDLSNKA
jgi:hypothetical protein